MSKTRIIPAELSDPVPLTDSQVDAMRKVLVGFRELFFILDDNLPTGPMKESIVYSLCELKLRTDSAVRSRAILTISRLADLFANVESSDQSVSRVVLSPYDFAVLRSDPTFKEIFEPSEDAAALRAGVWGRMWNASFVVSKSVPAGRIAVVGEREEQEAGSDWVPSDDQMIAI